MGLFKKLLHRHTWRKLKKQYSFREYGSGHKVQYTVASAVTAA